MASMTVEALERFLSRDGKSMFSNITFPSDIDKNIAVNEIIKESSAFEVLYADGDYMIEAVKLWSEKYYYTFQKWAKGFKEDFSPIDNYDRHEESENHRGEEDKTTYGKKDTTTYGKKDTFTNGKIETHEVSAYNSSTYQPEDKTSFSGNDSSQLSGSDSLQLSGSDTVNIKENSSYKTHVHGNIGVSTSTDVLTKWMDFYHDYNIYKMIADCYVSEFCIMVY